MLNGDADRRRPVTAAGPATASFIPVSWYSHRAATQLKEPSLIARGRRVDASQRLRHLPHCQGANGGRSSAAMALRLAWRQVSGGWFPRSLGRDGSWLFALSGAEGAMADARTCCRYDEGISDVGCHLSRSVSYNSTNPIAELIAPRPGSSSII